MYKRWLIILFFFNPLKAIMFAQLHSFFLIEKNKQTNKINYISRIILSLYLFIFIHFYF